MKLHLVCVGRLRADFARSGCDDYLSRLQRSTPLDVRETRDVRRDHRNAEAWKAEEAKRIRAHLPRRGTLVVLDERGREWGSRELARWLETQRERAVPAVTFVIGGPDGLDPSLVAQADRLWSLGKLTLPHELARLVLCEQLYRAASITAGGPYHRD